MAFLALLGASGLMFLAVKQFLEGEVVVGKKTKLRRHGWGFWLGLALYAGGALELFAVCISFLLSTGP
jgi:hypothetical protein